MRLFKLLIAYDGSDSSIKALQSLYAAGLPCSLDAVVLTVVDVWPPPDQPIKPAEPNWVTEAIAESEERRRKLVENAKSTASYAVDVLRARFTTWTIRAEGKADSPAWGIIKYADQWKPDLVVLGSNKRSAWGRLLLGSVSQQVLTHVNCSVRIIHPELSIGSSPRLIVGFDGSANAQLTANRVAERPWPKGTQVRLVTVYDRTIAALAEVGVAHRRRGNTPQGRREFWKNYMLRPVVLKMRNAGLRVEPVIREGKPADVLLREAKRWHASSLFVGARGLIAIERFLLGSVSTQVALKAPCTVEVVR